MLHFRLVRLAQILKYILDLNLKTTHYSVNPITSSKVALLAKILKKQLYICTESHDVILPSSTGCDVLARSVCLILSPVPFPALKHLGDPNTFSMWWRHTGFLYGKGFTIFQQILTLTDLYVDKNRRYLHNTSSLFGLKRLP